MFWPNEAAFPTHYGLQPQRPGECSQLLCRGERGAACGDTVRRGGGAHLQLVWNVCWQAPQAKTYQTIPSLLYIILSTWLCGSEERVRFRERAILTSDGQQLGAISAAVTTSCAAFWPFSRAAMVPVQLHQDVLPTGGAGPSMSAATHSSLFLHHISLFCCHSCCPSCLLNSYTQ